jgi:transposase
VQSKYARVQRFYDVTLKENKVSQSNEKIKKNSEPQSVLEWKRKEEDQSDKLFGCYVLRTDLKDLSAEKIWNLYMTLTRAESGFRSLKSTLGLRPNFHQKEDRVDGHVLITVLAYHLLRYINYVLEGVSDNRSWDTLNRILQTHCYTTMIVPTKNGKTYRIRKAGEPEEAHKDIYKKLGVDWKSLPSKKIIMETGKNETTL